MSLYALYEKNTKSYRSLGSIYSMNIDEASLFKTFESATKVLNRALKLKDTSSYQQIWYVDTYIFYNGDLAAFLKDKPNYKLPISELKPDLMVIEIALVVV